MSDSDEEKPKTRERKPSMVKYDSNPVETGDVSKVVIKVENLTNAKLITKEQLAVLVDHMSTKYEENVDRLAYLEEFKTPFLFDSASLLKIMSITTSIKTKLAFITMLGPRLTDPRAKSQELLDNFRFAEEKAKVEDVLKNRMNTIQSASFRVQSSKSSGGRGLGRGGLAGRGAGQSSRILASPSSSDVLDSPSTPQNTPPPVPITTPPPTTAPPPVPIASPTPTITPPQTANLTTTPQKSDDTTSSSSRRTSGNGKRMSLGIGALMRSSFSQLTSPQQPSATPTPQLSSPPPLPTAPAPTFDTPVSNPHIDIPAVVVAPVEERRQSVVLKDFVFNENFETEKSGYVESWEQTAVKEAKVLDDHRRQSLKMLGLGSFEEVVSSEAWELKAVKVDDKKRVSISVVGSEAIAIPRRRSSSSCSSSSSTTISIPVAACGTSNGNSITQNIPPSDPTDITSPATSSKQQRRASYFDSRQFKGVLQDGQQETTPPPKSSTMLDCLRDKLVMADAEDPIGKTSDGILVFSYNELIRRNFVKEYENLDKLNLEIHLSDDEFKGVFGATREDFKSFPKWKQIHKKKELLLF